MIRRRLSGIKLWFQIRCSYSEEQKQKIIDLIQSEDVAVHVFSCSQFETLFDILPSVLQCDKEDTFANRKFEWWKKYNYILYNKQFGRIECWDHPLERTVISYDEFWNAVFEKTPHINRHSLENLL